jgi:hypothetical protein
MDGGDIRSPPSCFPADSGRRLSQTGARATFIEFIEFIGFVELMEAQLRLVEINRDSIETIRDS